MADAGSEMVGNLAEAGLDRPARAVLFSPDAQADLEHLGRPTRAILSRTLRDLLLEPTATASVRPAIDPPDDEKWYELPVGKFRVVFRSIPPDTGGSEAERLVGRVVRADGEAVTDAASSRTFAPQA